MLARGLNGRDVPPPYSTVDGAWVGGIVDGPADMARGTRRFDGADGAGLEKRVNFPARLGAARQMYVIIGHSIPYKLCTCALRSPHNSSELEEDTACEHQGSPGGLRYGSKWQRWYVVNK